MLEPFTLLPSFKMRRPLHRREPIREVGRRQETGLRYKPVFEKRAYLCGPCYSSVTGS
jgi:hypothetical protein